MSANGVDRFEYATASVDRPATQVETGSIRPSSHFLSYLRITVAPRISRFCSVIARLEGGGITPTLLTLKRVADALETKLTVGFEEPRSGRKAKPTVRTAVKRTAARSQSRRSE